MDYGNCINSGVMHSPRKMLLLLSCVEGVGKRAAAGHIQRTCCSKKIVPPKKKNHPLGKCLRVKN